LPWFISFAVAVSCRHEAGSSSVFATNLVEGLARDVGEFVAQQGLDFSARAGHVALASVEPGQQRLADDLQDCSGGDRRRGRGRQSWRTCQGGCAYRRGCWAGCRGGYFKADTIPPDARMRPYSDAAHAERQDVTAVAMQRSVRTVPICNQSAARFQDGRRRAHGVAFGVASV
jgi:hypothetical protein